MNEPGWTEGLDEDQLAAVGHGEEPLVIGGRAGTGKTRTLTARVGGCSVRRPHRLQLFA